VQPGKPEGFPRGMRSASADALAVVPTLKKINKIAIFVALSVSN
tara:strand:- start:419 stop:550 length:132 start_codon:yes stop_codon:yes gene_type:complete